MKNFTTDSRKINEGDIFIAIKGNESDGHDFVGQAIAKGASKCIVEKNIPGYKGKLKVLKDTKIEFSRMSAKHFNNPSKKLINIGITGTNGKTTISFIVSQILKDAGYSSGIIGTIFYKSSNKSKVADRTTPDAYLLNSLLDEMVKNKYTHSIMEVSSHALEQKRVADIFYDIAVFTNLTPEHLDYHKHMNAYFKAKKIIFNKLKNKSKAIVNIDDKRGEYLKRELGRKCVGYSINRTTDVYAKNIFMDIHGSFFDVITQKSNLRIKTSLTGEYNVSNIVGAIAIAISLGIKKDIIIKSILKCKAPEGRLQRINTNKKASVFIDYAHTPDALENVLKTLSSVKEKDLITVFGCGGDRDKTKRSKMAKIAQKFSDKIIITSDNPRTEKPKDIIDDILKGINERKKNFYVLEDRKKAIFRALSLAKENSIVLIAGKGHEKYQLIMGKKFPFSDAKVVREFYNK